MCAPVATHVGVDGEDAATARIGAFERFLPGMRIFVYPEAARAGKAFVALCTLMPPLLLVPTTSWRAGICVVAVREIPVAEKDPVRTVVPGGRRV